MVVTTVAMMAPTRSRLRFQNNCDFLFKPPCRPLRVSHIIRPSNPVVLRPKKIGFSFYLYFLLSLLLCDRMNMSICSTL